MDQEIQDSTVVSTPTTTFVLSGNILSLGQLNSDGTEKTDFSTEKFDGSGNTTFLQSSIDGLVCVPVLDTSTLNNISQITSTEEFIRAGDLLATCNNETDGRFLTVSPNTSSSQSFPIQCVRSSIILQTDDTDVQPENEKKRKGGWPKGKKRKKGFESTSLPPAPKPPISGYMLFLNERRASFKVENPNASFVEMTRMLGTEWSSLSSEVKEKYIVEADLDKQRYIQELKDFQQSDEYKEYWKKRKVIAADGDNSTIGHDSDDDLLHMDERTDLYCKTCNQYFTTLHNKKEHMLGSKHFKNVTREFNEMVVQHEPSTIMEVTSGTGCESTTHNDSSLLSHSDDTTDQITDFTIKYIQRNVAREKELNNLRETLKEQEAKHDELMENIRTMEEMETKLLNDIAHQRAYSVSLSTQIEQLKMVPLLFGVINF